ncbi:hypothetical protein HNQ91_004650 [Filimonas zeae]|nr:hypothetical protein [Filimonas zeae]
MLHFRTKANTSDKPKLTEVIVLNKKTIFQKLHYNYCINTKRGLTAPL